MWNYIPAHNSLQEPRSDRTRGAIIEAIHCPIRTICGEESRVRTLTLFTVHLSSRHHGKACVGMHCQLQAHKRACRKPHAHTWACMRAPRTPRHAYQRGSLGTGSIVCEAMNSMIIAGCVKYGRVCGGPTLQRAARARGQVKLCSWHSCMFCFEWGGYIAHTKAVAAVTCTARPHRPGGAVEQCARAPTVQAAPLTSR